VEERQPELVSRQIPVPSPVATVTERSTNLSSGRDEASESLWKRLLNRPVTEPSSTYDSAPSVPVTRDSRVVIPGVTPENTRWLHVQTQKDGESPIVFRGSARGGMPFPICCCNAE
jgi:hypothetical protein